MQIKKIITVTTALVVALGITACNRNEESTEPVVNYVSPDANISLHFDGNLINDGNSETDVKNFGTLGYKEKGVLNQAFTFTDGYLELLSNDSFNVGKKFSVSLWVKGNDLDACVDPILFGREPSSGEINEGPLCICFYEGYSFLKTDITFKYPGDEYKSYSFSSDKVFSKSQIANAWNNIVVVFDNDTISYYLNGEIINQERLPVEFQDYEVIASNNKPYFIGRAPIGNYNGFIDEFKFYDKAISEKDIKLIYEEGIQQYTNKLVFTVDSDKFTVNGTEFKLSAKPSFNTDAECAMIPAKDVIEAMGGKFDFDKSDSHGRIDIIYKDDHYSMWIMDTNASSNQTHIKLDAYPFVDGNNVVMIPVSFLSKQLSANVKLDAQNRVCTVEY